MKRLTVPGRISTFLAALVLFMTAFVPRLYHLQYPVYDMDSFRQSDTYAMTLLIRRGKTDMFHPRLFSSVAPDNIKRYYFAEFPVFEQAGALLMNVFGESPVVLRIMNILMSAAAAVVLYFIVRKLYSPEAGILASLLFSFYPASFYWGRTVMPDVSGLFFFVLSVGLLYLDFRNRRRATAASAVCFALAVLTKTFYLAFIPLLYYLFRRERAWTGKSAAAAVAYAALPVFSFLAWQWWAIHESTVVRDPSIMIILTNRLDYFTYYFSTGWMAKLLSVYLMGSLLTPFGGLLLIAGAGYLWGSRFAGRTMLFLWLAGNMLISLVVAHGSFMQEYYNLHWLPTAAAAGGIFLVHAFRNIRSATGKIGWVASVLVFLVLAGIFPFISVSAVNFENKTQFTSEDDFKNIRRLIGADGRILTIVPNYDPYLLTRLEHEGSVMAPKTCLTSVTERNLAQDLLATGIRYVVVQKTGFECDYMRMLNVFLIDREKVLYDGAESVLLGRTAE